MVFQEVFVCVREHKIQIDCFDFEWKEKVFFVRCLVSNQISLRVIIFFNLNKKWLVSSENQ